MKPILVLGIILGVAFAMVWYFQIWSAGRWKTTLKEEGNGVFYASRQHHADAEAFAREAENDDPNTANPSTDVASSGSSSSGSSWVDRLENLVSKYMRAIKGAGHQVGHQPRLAPPGVYFTLTYLSVRTRSGITGLGAGTQVVRVKDEGPVVLVKFGNVEFDVKRQYLTNDLDVADIAARNDAEAQQAVAAYMAEQQQEIEDQDDRSNMQPSQEQ
jgi:hypothetical protein